MLPIALPPRLSTLACCLLLVACGQRAPVTTSPAEAASLAYIERTPYLEILSLERLQEHHLLVTTRQGDVRVRYLIDSSDPETRPEDRVHRVPDRGLRYTYDRTKPRGGWQGDRRL